MLNSSPRTALELKSNDKRPFFYIYCVVFPFILSQHLKSCDHLLLLKTCLFTFSVLPWINKIQLQFETNAKVLFVWSPTWLWKAGKIMFYNQNLNIFALVLKWWLSLLTIIFMLIKGFSVCWALCNKDGKTYKKPGNPQASKTLISKYKCTVNKNMVR